MSVIHDINEIYENVKEKAVEAHNRNLGTLDFNYRVLQEVNDDRNEISRLKRLDFLEIFFSNMIEFIQVRYSRVNKKSEKEELHDEIESILSKTEETLHQYIETSLPDEAKKYSKDFDGVSFFRIVNRMEENWNPETIYILLGDSTRTEILALPFNSPIIVDDGKIFELTTILKVLLKNHKFLWVYPFRVIPNRAFPYYWIGYESSYEMLEDLEEVLAQKESLKLYGVLVSNQISLDPSEESHLDKFSEIFHKDLEIFQTKTDYPIFGGRDLQRQYQKLPSVKLGDTKMIQKAKRDIMINLNRVNLYPGILFETPFVSYNTVLQLIHRECFSAHNLEYETKWPGAPVPKTTAIFMSLYRVQKDSEIIEDLVHAAKHDIKVFVYVEPLARDNEKENLQIIKRLKKAGVHVISDYCGIKVHAKAFLSLRSDGTMVAHISTGNYDIRRVGTFTDYQFITQNTQICEEVLEFFKMLIQKQPLITKLDYFGEEERYVKIAPIAMRDTIIDECDNRVCQRIYIKCNNLCDSLVIRKLYKASERGIDIKVICRTSCSMIPKNDFIHIRSNTGKYLEHGRFYCFDDRVYIGSADLLLRNLNKRIELMVRIPEDVSILAKHGTDLIQESIQTNNPSIAADEYTLENSDQYFLRCFKEAKWIKRKEDFRFKSILDQ